MNTQPAQHYIVLAGERSGDQLGGALIESLKTHSPIPLTFSGIGGEDMLRGGFASIFPMEELSLMGFVEVLPHIRRLKRRIRETVAYIQATKSAIVISIDSPGFTFRVVKALRKQGYSESIFIHYVAPTVWAYKPERAAKTAALFDALLTLFAFEPAYFTKEHLPTFWVGHNAAWAAPEIQPPMHSNQHLCLFAGSRRNELKRHLPIYRDVVREILLEIPSLTLVMPLPLSLHVYAKQLTQNWPCAVDIIDSAQRYEMMRSSRAALIKSGTITLECGLYGLAGVIIYKAHPISAWIIRRLVRTPFAGLPNILLGREVMPECIQANANAVNIVRHIMPLLRDNDALAKQRSTLAQLRPLLLPDASTSPSDIAAMRILDIAHTERSAATSSS